MLGREKKHIAIATVDSVCIGLAELEAGARRKYGSEMSQEIANQIRNIKLLFAETAKFARDNGVQL